MKVIPASADRIEKREKHNKYILATRGPLSRFAVRIGYVPPLEKPRRPGPQRPRRPGFSGVQCPSGLPRFGEERADQRLVLVRGEAILRMVLSQFPPDYM